MRKRHQSRKQIYQIFPEGTALLITKTEHLHCKNIFFNLNFVERKFILVRRESIRLLVENEMTSQISEIATFLSMLVEFTERTVST